MTTEQVILVDTQDLPLGQEEKLKAHQLGLLHRALSVCVIRPSSEGWELLLQQRAMGKYHSGGLWTNTCCSHPRPGETILEAAKRRLQEEMGFNLDLTSCGSFIYKAHLDQGLTEHEFDHVFLGIAPAHLAILPNPEEVMAYRWVKLTQLKQDLLAQPAQYTAWLAAVITAMEQAPCLHK